MENEERVDRQTERHAEREGEGSIDIFKPNREKTRAKPNPTKSNECQQHHRTQKHNNTPNKHHNHRHHHHRQQQQRPCLTGRTESAKTGAEGVEFRPVPPRFPRRCFRTSPREAFSCVVLFRRAPDPGGGVRNNKTGHADRGCAGVCVGTWRSSTTTLLRIKLRVQNRCQSDRAGWKSHGLPANETAARFHRQQYWQRAAAHTAKS